ncbi:MAG: amidohydrolase family protein [Cyclobacteriaceae bacterium]|nr:amidohydrolase family protein [Cyclobacteriaceae bacterium]
MKRILIIFLIITGSHLARGQENFPVNGVQDERPEIYAFKNATIFADFSSRIIKGTLIIEDGFVKEVGPGVQIPDGAVVVDLEGFFIYPGLIDIYTDYGMPDVKRPEDVSRSAQYDSERKEGSFGWNDAIHSDHKAVNVMKLTEKKAEKFRSQGIGTVLTFLPDGIVRGSSSLVNLIDGPIQESIVIPEAAAHYSLDKGSSSQAYPSSKMGAIALLRQTYYDAEWYRSPLNRKQTNLSLQYFNELQSLPQIFDIENKQDIMRIWETGREFNVSYIVKGAGDEYQRITEISETGLPLIIPVNFPEAYDVANPDDALNLSLEEMKHWEMAPANLSMIESAGIPFAITSYGLKDPEDLLKNIRKAIKYGLSQNGALQAMTETPARLLNADKKLGGLRSGSYANFLITSDSLFSEGTVIYENWIMGKRYVVEDIHIARLEGTYDLVVEDITYELHLTIEKGDLKPAIHINDTTEMKVNADFAGGNVFFSFKPDEEGSLHYRLTGWETADGFRGNGQKNNGDQVFWTAFYRGKTEKKDTVIHKVDQDSLKPGEMIYPFVAYGWQQETVMERVLFKNATLWTNESAGILQSSDVLVEDGKIARVGENLTADNARIVDATGKHLTSGIIDEHSHIALSSVNEFAEAVTSEVRMKDVLDSEDINIYRQLAGGVTVAQLLHGSANPIGGQSAIIKFRWGNPPSGLLIGGADEFIKFALGENVKQSNAGADFVTRFPQTRMGVEQVMADAFTRAREYRESLETYEKLNKKQKKMFPRPRKDLELEALAEILNKERFITCHSYVQSEINMLIKLAEQFGFTVNTFTHILEGYKVADKMLAHGAGGSSFSDWWAYKYEVREAIPYNAALMNEVGVVTAINSDDAEMARRLNQEAAKAIKYGGVSEEDAWKMVTLNPAKLLHLDHRMGSIAEGKDADLVLWSDNPLSIYAKAEKTMVDGIFYYETEKDAERREWIRKERARLVEKMGEAKIKGEKTQKAKKKYRHMWQCNDVMYNNF